MPFFRFLVICASLANFVSGCGGLACSLDATDDAINGPDGETLTEKGASSDPATESAPFLVALSKVMIAVLSPSPAAHTLDFLQPRQLVLATSSGLSPPA